MERLKVLKTYKIFIGGKFPRTESGRFYQPLDATKKPLANMCLSSRKDLRNAVVAARGAVEVWSGATAYNRSQILYRLAEMLEGRRSQFEEELIRQGSTKTAAKKEVDTTVDRWVYYAGWCDKYQQLYSSVNPVATSHFNFSILEPTGVVLAVAPEEGSLLGITSLIAPVIASGNACIALASESKPLCAISLAEVIATSDVPGGVINMLTGKYSELEAHFVSHMDVNALWYGGNDKNAPKRIEEGSAANLKRVKTTTPSKDLYAENWQSPYLIKAFTEVKTTWHPIENVGGANASY
ncbi:MAG: aldehyde dehydrogenase family protein [Flavobacteriales bacterium]|nr:aldehyde dehydrogenase family protein [Flavobacteriales bacterium]